jgi:hypothetical protein
MKVAHVHALNVGVSHHKVTVRRLHMGAGHSSIGSTSHNAGDWCG